MKKINLNKMPWTNRRSPKGKYRIAYRNVAAEFRSGNNHGPRFRDKPPFEFAVVRVRPGAANFPFHSHAAEWEFYQIVSGNGVMRAGKKRFKVAAGDLPDVSARRTTSTHQHGAKRFGLQRRREQFGCRHLVLSRLRQMGLHRRPDVVPAHAGKCVSRGRGIAGRPCLPAGKRNS